MKKLKIGISALIFTLVFFALSASSSFATGTATIDFSSPTQKVNANQLMIINVTVDSDVPVNAVQVKIAYPADSYKLLSINSTGTQFSIKAEEKSVPGAVVIARGNIQPRTGKNLLTVLTFQSLKPGAISDFVFSPQDSAVMTSFDNTNILSGSQIVTLRAGTTPTPTPFPYTYTSTNFNSSPVATLQDFIGFVWNLAQHTFHSIFK